MSFSKSFKKHKVLFITLIAPIIIAALAGLFFLAGLFVQWIWAETISDIFGVKEISFWQAIGLLVLSRLLFSNSFNVTKTSNRKKDSGTGEKNFEFNLGKDND
ncbi:MAG TPA: hypothetical protein PLK90_03860 [Clostridiales bacterium]|jgi:uncharacterized membrane protein|nr:hypothetical protein [Clostridiales bacterium]HQP69516.1 hypothetical protein [Clostridiales bacterium]